MKKIFVFALLIISVPCFAIKLPTSNTTQKPDKPNNSGSLFNFTGDNSGNNGGVFNFNGGNRTTPSGCKTFTSDDRKTEYCSDDSSNLYELPMCDRINKAYPCCVASPTRVFCKSAMNAAFNYDVIRDVMMRADLKRDTKYTITVRWNGPRALNDMIIDVPVAPLKEGNNIDYARWWPTNLIESYNKVTAWDGKKICGGSRSDEKQFKDTYSIIICPKN